MPTEIHITIDEKGQVTTEVLGVTGASCQQLSKPFTDLFDDGATTLKPEFHEETGEQRTRQRQGS